METSFTDSLPSDLVNHITAMCGKEGEEWFESLPAVIKHLETVWSVSVGQPFPGIEFNFVASAVRRGGDLAVVKISPPIDSPEIFGEAKWLATRAGRGSIELIAKDVQSRAILIEHALPGKSLTECFTGSELDAIAPAIVVLRSVLNRPPADRTDTISLDDWFDGMTRYGVTRFPAGYASKALKIYEKLSSQTGRTYYLHGDFHPGNIVTATRSPFLAIDPKGIIGHMGYEIAVFLNNFHWWQDSRSDIRDRLDRAVKQFSDAFDISPLELRQWAFAQMVLSAWWTFDEMPKIYDDEVALADIWDV